MRKISHTFTTLTIFALKYIEITLKTRVLSYMSQNILQTALNEYIPLSTTKNSE